MTFSTIKELENYLKKEVVQGLKTRVAGGIMMTEIIQAEEKVYGVYSEPEVYERRRAAGGLTDPKNQKIVIRGTTLTMYNETPPNPDYDDKANDGCKVVTPGNLVELIEYGGHYTHRHSKKPEGPTFLSPRPFMRGTRDELAITKQHVHDLASYLRSQGMTVIES